MIKDIALIRKQLMGFSEVEMPYDFEHDCIIQYITNRVVDDIEIEYFSTGGKFIRRCNDILILEINGNNKVVPICKRDKHGTVVYQSRFFIEDNDNKLMQGGGSKSSKSSKSSNDIIKYQQSIIDKLIEKVKDVELEKQELHETIATYEDLLQEGRFKLKDLSIELRDKIKKIDHYEELIPKLYASR